MNNLKARGLGLVSAIFFLLVISLLALAIARSVKDAGDSSAIERLGFQALLVAQSGAQVSVAHAVPASGSPVCATTSYDFSPFGHRNCQAIVACQAKSSSTRTIYEIRSRGRCELPSGEVTERIIEVAVQP